MAKRFLAALVLAFWAAFAAAQGAGPDLKPGPKDTCPVCGMLVAKYPTWVAAVQFRDGHIDFFDGPKDMFKYLHELGKYAPGHRKEDITGLYVTEFYGLARIDARKAFYVIGSDAMGPMGHELVPLETKADAEEFLRDHKGKRILAFAEVTPAIVAEVDAGRF